MTRADDVEGLVWAAGHGTRLGRGPKAFLRLGDTSLVEKQIETFAPLCSRLIIAVPVESVTVAQQLTGGLNVDVIAGGGSRMETLCLLLERSQRQWVIITDVVHPFVEPELARRVLAAARRDGAACVAIRNAEYVYDDSKRRTFDPGALWELQKPIACRANDLKHALCATDVLGGGGEVSILQLLQYSGQATTFVAGPATNLKVTDARDWRLALALQSVLGSDDRDA